MTVISLDEVEVASTSVARRNPGVSHVKKLGDTSCAYTMPNGEHCFVGAVAEALALPLPSRYSAVNTGGVQAYNSWLRNQTGKEFSASAKDYLLNAQLRADQGYYWSDVV